jgi:microcin C transport system ATP-binding protein
MRGMRGDDIAMIFQEPMTALNPLYTVGNQIGEVLELHAGLRRTRRARSAIELLARTGIPDPSGASMPSRTSCRAASGSAR